VAAPVEELDEGLLEVEAGGADLLLEIARGAVEEQLAVGEDDQLARVAVGLLDVVRGVDDRGALAREPEDELPQTRALARVANALLEKETLDRVELEALLADVSAESRSSETIGTVQALPARD